MSSPIAIPRPGADEYFPYYATYIARVPGDDALPTLVSHIEAWHPTLRGLSEAQAMHRYAPGKWSVKEVIGHLCDGERVFAYRALRFARNDRTRLPGFEGDDYVAAARFDRRPWNELLDEFEAVRRATILMFGGLDGEAWLRRGVASDNEVSVRTLAYNIAGHELHHLQIVRTKYLPAAMRDPSASS